ncbi:hypothetical protein BDR04DRAFT_966115, partial [Suillus decipiens]
EKASWNEDEVDAFVDYLHKEQSKAGETGNFKPAVYTAAAENIAGLWTNGAKKTGAHCKTKWTALKQIYSTIETYRNRSGFHWDDDHGAGI